MRALYAGAGGSPSERTDDVVPLRNLRARDGVLAVSGNHEAFYGFAAWKAVYESRGIRFLERVYAGPLAAHRGLQSKFSPRTVSVRIRPSRRFGRLWPVARIPVPLFHPIRDRRRSPFEMKGILRRGGVGGWRGDPKETRHCRVRKRNIPPLLHAAGMSRLLYW